MISIGVVQPAEENAMMFNKRNVNKSSSYLCYLLPLCTSPLLPLELNVVLDPYGSKDD